MEHGFWATEKESKIYEELFELIFPAVARNSKLHKNRVADVGHLLGHMRAKRDIFVTRDGPILERKNELLWRFGISVMTSAEAMRHCEPK